MSTPGFLSRIPAVFMIGGIIGGVAAGSVALVFPGSGQASELASSSGLSESGPSEADDGGLERLRAYLDGLDILRANFRQEVVNRDLELVEEAAGEVILQKPGRFRWNYVHPFERVIVADGDRVWLYEADLQQVTVRRFDSGLGETPAALLTGDTKVLEQFDYQGSTTDAGIEWMQLSPHAAESDFERIYLGFDGQKLVQIELDDRLGQRTRLYLTQIERPTSVPDDTFRFVVPDGVDVIGERDL